MADGGDRLFDNPTYEEPSWDDDYGDETRPFIPTSTPIQPGGKQIEMQAMIQKEQAGLPDESYVETSFSAPTLSQQAWATAKDLFPNISSSNLEVSHSTNGSLQDKMFGGSKKLYYLMTTENRTGLDQINKSLPKK